MDHFTEDQLNEYLDDALEVPAQARLSAHLSECADCRARLAALQTVFELLAALPDEKPGRDLAPSILQNLPHKRSGLGWKLALAFQAGVSFRPPDSFYSHRGKKHGWNPAKIDRSDHRTGNKVVRSDQLAFQPAYLLLPHPPSLPAPVPQIWVTLPVAITQANFPIWLILGIAAILLFVIGNYSLILNGSSKSKK